MSSTSSPSRGARRGLVGLAALIACAATIALGTGSASAILLHVSGNHWISYAARITSRASGVSGSAQRPGSVGCDSDHHNLDYVGGPVMPSSTNYVIAWIPQGYTGNPFQDNDASIGDTAGWNNTFPCTAGTQIADRCGFVYGVGKYFTDLAADSALANGGSSGCQAANPLTGTNNDSVSTQYNDGFGHVVGYNVCYGGGGTGPSGVWIDHDSVPSVPGQTCTVTAPAGSNSSDTGDHGGWAKGSGGMCITDAQLQSELAKFTSANNLPVGITNEYYVLAPPDVVMCSDPTNGGAHCSANAPVPTQQNPNAPGEWCGYHSATNTARGTLVYANILDAAGSPPVVSTLDNGLFGCDPFATDFSQRSQTQNSPYFYEECQPYPGWNGCNYNTSWAEASLSAISHEHNESITDPTPPMGWEDLEQNLPNTPTYSNGRENGDLCNNDEAEDTGTSWQYDQNNSVSTPYNYTINGTHYWLQMLWSNQGNNGGQGQCDHSLAPEQHPGSSFTVTHQSGNIVSLHANGGGFPVADYVWEFNDYVQPGFAPGPVYTLTCPASGGGPTGCYGSTVNVAFPQGGVYNVALTVQDNDGRSWGSRNNVHVYSSPHAAFTVGGTRVEGSSVFFNGSPSSHDPGLTITRYAWRFGDGTTATGRTVSHVYHRGGAFTVTLTVTDSAGQTASISHQVRITPLCHVPNVKGDSLSRARNALSNAGCAVGKVKRPSRHRNKPLVVGSQSIPPGRVKPPGTKVNLTLVYK